MKLPDTPKTIIKRLSDNSEMSVWNGAWKHFFDIYHAPIKVMVGNSFYKRGWYGVPASVVDEVVAETIVSLNDIFNRGAYDSTKSRFRNFLKTICDRRVVDYLRKNAKNAAVSSIDNEDDGTLNALDRVAAGSQKVLLEEEEISAFKRSLILDAYMTIRNKFDAKTCAAFEMIKLEDIDAERVGAELGMSPNAVNNSVFRIMKKLKETIFNDEKFREELK